MVAPPLDTPACNHVTPCPLVAPEWVTQEALAEAAPGNLVHCVFDNRTYAVNGGHPIPGAGKTDFAGLAEAAGYRKVYRCADIARLPEAFSEALEQDGPVFVDLQVDHDREVPFDYDALFSAERRSAFKAALDRFWAAEETAPAPRGSRGEREHREVSAYASHQRSIIL